MDLSTNPVRVSVIIPVFNGEAYLEDCLKGIEFQWFPAEECHRHDPVPDRLGQIEIQVSIYDDASTDSTPGVIRKWEETFIETTGNSLISDRPITFSLIQGRNTSGEPKGVGYAKNRAIEQSSGDFLCFCDADDIMLPHRIWKQLQISLQYPAAIIGSQFIRIPEDSTRNFTHWANHLTQDQLDTQIFLTFGPTLVMPTWFCSREAFLKVPGGFTELKSGSPEDLIFFYKHLDLGGSLHRVDEPLIQYRYHPSSATFSVLEETIRRIRLDRLEDKVLQNWSSFSIWNAGKLGKRFYRSLKPENQAKVTRFYDVDHRKIQCGWYHPLPMKIRIPIAHIRDASPPLIICVKTELTFDEDGPFQILLKSLGLVEGVDYFYFN